MTTRVRWFVPEPAHVQIHNRKYIRRENMRRNISIAILGLVLFASAVNSVAQVKRVQMHIAGYLCGN